MPRPTMPLLFVAACALLASACTDQASIRFSGDAFPAIRAPLWRAGYYWGYEVTLSEYLGDRTQGISHNEKQEASVRVRNTTTSLDGVPVYYVDVDAPSELPLFQDGYMAFTRDDLSPLAHGPEVIASSGTPGCEAGPTVRRIPSAQRLPFLRFPLDEAKTWSGNATAPGSAQELAYVAKVHGTRPVKVPAGTFDAVLVQIHFAYPRMATPLLEHGTSAEEFRFRFDVYYSPDLRFVVKFLSYMSGRLDDRRTGSSESFASQTLLELSSYSLRANPESPAPNLDDSPVPQSTPSYQAQIVTDRRFPMNMAENSTVARFGLDLYPTSADVPPSMRQGEPVPQRPDYDHDLYAIDWELRRVFSGESVVATRGDVFETQLEQGGRYEVRALLRPHACQAPPISYASASFVTFLDLNSSALLETGLPRTVTLATFDVASNPVDSLVSWQLNADATVWPPDGVLIIVSPDGSSNTHEESPRHLPASIPGQWILRWRADSPTQGETVFANVRIDY